MLNMGILYLPLLFRTENKTEQMWKYSKKGVRDMKKKSLRILSLIVAIVMVVAMLPLSALADETGPKRRVGVVVYGAELTAVLTNIEKSFKDGVASIENGDAEAAVENTKNSLETLVELATSFTTGAIDGTGFSVPDLDLEVKDKDGITYSMTEQPVEIFTQTTEMDLPLEQDLEERLDLLDTDIKDLKTVLKDWKPIKEEIDIVGINGKIHDLSDNINAIDFQVLADQISGVVNKLVGDLAKVSGLEGKLYRTYVVDKELTVGETYTAYIKGFTDTDENDNPVTRDGYIVYNDGLTKEEGGSMFNTTRSFSFEVNARGRFHHEIQFVGPKAGIEGTLVLDENFTKAYDNMVKGVNDLIKLLSDTRSWLSDSEIASLIKKVLSGLFDAEELINWFETRTFMPLKQSDEIDKHYEFTFPGIWCAEYDAGFSFRNVDVGENPIEGSKFLLINRQELLDVLKFMKDLGKDAFMGALTATFGGDYTYEGGDTITYEGITDLYTQLLKTEEGEISLDYETAYAIVKTYLGVIVDMNLFDRVIEKDPDDIFCPLKLKYPIPAILEAESDKNGIVTFSKSSNKTLSWILELLPTIGEYATKAMATVIKDGESNSAEMVVELLTLLNNYSAKMAGIVSGAVNVLVYPFAQRLGLVGPKLASGQYLMFQTSVPDGYYRNPLAYTMDLSWDNGKWEYVTAADLGIIAPYFAEGFYDFVRDTTVAGTIDKFLSQGRGEETTVLSDILNGKINVTEKASAAAMGALTAFAAQIGYENLGADKLFATKSDFISDMNKYLIQNGETAQNLIVYLNRTAMRSKTGYTGKVDDGWYFYNVNKSPTTTATKLINKATTDLVNATAVEIRKPVVQKVGDTVQSIVEKVGTHIETNVKKVQDQIKNSIGQAIKSIAEKAIDSVKTSIVNFFKGIFA